MTELNGKFIVIGDMHLGHSNFKENVFENQLRFFTKQLIPYMKENNIKYIIQTGDFLDNRRLMDINLFDTICSKLMEELKCNNICIITFLGNHDLYYKDIRTVSMMKYIEKLYPENIYLIQDNTNININGNIVSFIPWICNQDENKNMLNFIKNSKYIFGHFEIKDFYMTKNMKDQKSELEPKDFKNKIVYSGHYHIRNDIKNIMYVGTPYQLNWNDFGNKCGFMVFDESMNSIFIENNVSERFVYFNYYINNIEIDFGFDEIINLGHKDFIDKLDYFKNTNIKFQIQESKDNLYEELLFYMKEKDMKFSVINNVELSKIINPENIEQSKVSNTSDFILDYIKQNASDLTDLASDIIGDVMSGISDI